ncbi:hypothetical protein [Pararhodobacter marinus]|uniref:hypothetical protein n=1 Tax=Pararhodobacter marinus TaxID=2184063 RepID=UPI003515E70B
MRTILHVGPHKTGTTTIQGAMSDGREALLQKGIDFPIIGRRETGAQAHRYFSAFMRGVTSEYDAGFEASARAWRPDADTVVLSSEDFWFGSTTEQIDRLHDLVPGIDTVVFFSREPVSHLVSLYKESIKGPNAGTLGDMLDLQLRQLEKPKAGYAYYRFEENLDRWRQRADVKVVKHERNMDILASFFDAAGLEKDALSDLPGAPNLNAADSDVVCALRLSINHALKRGELDAEGSKRFKKILARKAGKEFSERHRDKLIEQRFETKAFFDGFVAFNPSMADLHSPPASDIGFREFRQEDAKRILEELVA